MKIVDIDYDIRLELSTNEKNVIVIENQIAFRSFLQELIATMNGFEGNIVLSRDNKILKIKDNVDLIISPFDIDLNSKKIQNKLYANLKEKAYNEFYFEKTMKLQSEILRYLYELENDSEYMLSVDEMDIGGLFKSFGVCIEGTNDLLEKLDSYVKLISRLLKIKILVLVNFAAYFEEKEIDLIHKNALYEEVILIFIESEDKIKSKNKIIIDKDRCRIV